MTVQDKCASGDEQLDEAIAEFLRADSADKAGDRQLWLDRYPACAAGLIEFFDDREQIHHLAMAARVDRQGSSSGLEATGMFDSPDSPPNSPSKVPTVDVSPAPPQFATPRYRPLRFHARGGMGEIWLAEDERIGRRVALKKLRSGRDVQQVRFQIEAQVTGQLEHPSIVPMHDLGFDDAGQPFYVMKFIQGRRLSEAITDYHADKTFADWPADLQFLRLLETLISVCYAVAYAHSKGVLHRDIKPDNIMLGPYGETLVLDWGLARVIGQPDAPGSAIVRISGGGSSDTQDGAIIGSPCYMSPEGAEGGTDAVDQANDVYLLGATLYEILTARPPRQGSSQWELINLARNSRPTKPRKLDHSIPRALEAICLKAMSFCKQDRYETPVALAEDVQRYLAGEPTVAYQEPLLARTARWIRRYRRGILRGAAILCVLVLAVFGLQSYRQARMLADREHARGQLTEFDRLADEAQFYAASADAVSERVPYYDPRRAKAVGESARAIAAPWGQQAEQLPLSDQRTEFLQTYNALLLLMARADLQSNQQPLGAREALALLDEARVVEPPSRGYYQLRSRCLALMGQAEAAQRAREQADSPNTAVRAGDHFLQGELLRVQDAGATGRMIGDESDPRREHLAKAIEAYRAALALDPRHYWARFQLGRCLLALGRGPEAIEALSACIAVRPTSLWAYTARGLASAVSGRSDEAIVDLNRAVQLDPDFQPARLNRGVAHWLFGNTEAAISDFNAVLAAPSDKRLIEAGYYRGQLLLQQQRTREALADLSMVIDSRPDFRPAYWQRALARFRLEYYDAGESDLAKFVKLGEAGAKDDGGLAARFSLGKALRRMALELDGDAQKQVLVGAVDELQAAISAGEPGAEAFQHLGAVQELLGRAPAALASYSQGLTIAVGSVPLRNQRGWAYALAGQYDPARADFSEALRLAPDNPDSHAGLGFVLAHQGAPADAETEASSALLSGSDNYIVLHNIACIYGRLSESAPAHKVEHENMAIVVLKRAVELSRQNPARPDEFALIRQEAAFPDSLRSRPEFQQLLSGQALTDR